MKLALLKKFASSKLKLTINTLAVLLLFQTVGIAQCLVTSLNASSNPANTSWYVSNKTGLYAPTTPPIGSNVIFPSPIPGGTNGWDATTSGWGAHWISDTQSHVTPGLTTYSAGAIFFSRQFKTCEDASIDFNLSFRSDGRVENIYVDGIIVSTVSWLGNWKAIDPIAGFIHTMSLSAGTHIITFEVVNPAVNMPDPIGLAVSGTIASASAVIVNDNDPNCAGYECNPQPCSDKCYWKVEGNNILNGNNIFGTLTNDDIDIQTNATSRGVITNAGRMGWGTTAPTALMHLNCNAVPYIGPSNVRIEHLPAGAGHILVIDDNGYVYRTERDVASLIGGGDEEVTSMKQEIRELKAQLAELRSAVASGSSNNLEYRIGNELYQNNPNPFGKETSISYNIANMQQNAFIAIYDLNGKELYKYAITEKGKGSIMIGSEKLQPGIYLYSLVVDGKETDTKRMVVSK